MRHITEQTANNLFIEVSRQLLRDGNRRSPRGKETIELPDTFLTLTNPSESIVTLPARKLSTKYLEAEMDWYKNGTYNASEIGKHSSFWYGLSNDEGQVNSNYGMMVFREHVNGLNQFEWCRLKLLDDVETRQAVINYNQPKHKDLDTKDFPCTITQMFRNGPTGLDSTTVMRSNDLIYGLSYDLPWFTHLQTELADAIKTPVGEYNHFAASLHVYERHFDMLERIAGSQKDV